MFSKLIKFGLVGGVSTIVSYALFVLLSASLGQVNAYLAGYAVGIAISTFGNARYTFNGKRLGFRLMAFVVIYLAIAWVVSQLVGYLERAGLRAEISGLVAVGVGLILSFSLMALVSKFLLREKRAVATHDAKLGQGS